jgi:hypothetical protein
LVTGVEFWRFALQRTLKKTLEFFLFKNDVSLRLCPDGRVRDRDGGRLCAGQQPGTFNRLAAAGQGAIGPVGAALLPSLLAGQPRCDDDGRG